MNMGYNRIALAATGDGTCGAEATIPVCVTRHMQWRAMPIVETASQRIAVPFRFDAPTVGS
jgi:hypothetical protein